MENIKKTSGCWLWLGTKFVGGYGRTGYSKRAHRVAWEEAYGPIPPGMLVCHKCDVPSCVKPTHLFLGTSADNRHDCDKKKRHNCGERVWTNKLTAAQVLEIRKLYIPSTRVGRGQDRVSDTEIGRRYGVSHRMIGLILHNKSWRHLL